MEMGPHGEADGEHSGDWEAGLFAKLSNSLCCLYGRELLGARPPGLQSLLCS